MGNQVKPVRFLLAGTGLDMCGHPVILVGASGEGLDMGSYNYIKGCT